MVLTTFFRKPTLFVVLVLALSGCASIPQDVLMLSPESLEQRQIQSRKYETKDEKQILSACSGVLQDLGFTLDDSETKLGLITASKSRDATDALQVTGAAVLTALYAVGGVYYNALNDIDGAQKMRASTVSMPGSDGNIIVRVTFQRMVWNRRGDLSRVETLNDPTLYQGFFEKLSKSVFLEAQKI
jgi:hypothetical protein